MTTWILMTFKSVMIISKIAENGNKYQSGISKFTKLFSPHFHEKKLKNAVLNVCEILCFFFNSNTKLLSRNYEPDLSLFLDLDLCYLHYDSIEMT